MLGTHEPGKNDKEKPSRSPEIETETPTTTSVSKEAAPPSDDPKDLARLSKPSARTMTPQNLLAYQRTLGNQATMRMIARYRESAPASRQQPAPQLVQRLYAGQATPGIKLWRKLPDGKITEVEVKGPIPGEPANILISPVGQMGNIRRVPRSELYDSKMAAEKSPEAVSGSAANPAAGSVVPGQLLPGNPLSSLSGSPAGTGSTSNAVLDADSLNISGTPPATGSPISQPQGSATGVSLPAVPKTGASTVPVPKNMLESINLEMYGVKDTHVLEAESSGPEQAAPVDLEPDLADPKFIAFLRDADSQAHLLRLGAKRVHVAHDLPWWRFFVVTYLFRTKTTPFPDAAGLKELYNIYFRNKPREADNGNQKKGKLQLAKSFFKALTLGSLKRLFLDPFLNLRKAKDLGKIWDELKAYYLQARGMEKGFLNVLVGISLTFLKAASEFINILNDIIAAVALTTGLLGLALAWNPVGGALLGISAAVAAIFLWTSAIQAALEALRGVTILAAALATKEPKKKAFLYGQAKEAGVRSLKGMINFFFGGFGNYFGGAAGALQGGSYVPAETAYNPLAQVQGAAVTYAAATPATTATMGVISAIGGATGVPMSHDEEHLNTMNEQGVYKDSGFMAQLAQARQEQGRAQQALAGVDAVEKPAARTAMEIPRPLRSTGEELKVASESSDLDMHIRVGLSKAGKTAGKKATQLEKIGESTSGSTKD